MKISSKTHRLFRVQQIIFYVLLVTAIILLANFSKQHDHQWDWTQNSRHTLSETTIEFLQQLDANIDIQIFVSPNNEYQAEAKKLIDRYQAHSDQLTIQFINPDFSPDLVRQHNIQQQAEMVITKGEKTEHIYDLSEQSLTNALISVSRHQQPWLLFIEGHGERSPLSKANFNLSTWGQHLTQKGFKIQPLNLIEHKQIPHNTAAIVIASPEKPWLTGEIELLKNYINDGGNLLWLSEPDSNQHLSELAEQLDIEFIAGTVMDPNAELLGIDDPQFVLITDFANHPIATATNSVTIFPQAVAMEVSNVESQWQHIALLTSQDNTWSKADLTKPAEFDINTDTAGPLSLAYLLTRSDTEKTDEKEQRIAVIGDGDFVSNTYIGNAGNLDFAVALVNWLVQEDELITIPVKITLDNQLDLTQTESLIIGLGFFLVIPIILLAIGFMLWWYRRKR
jgi:gliding motility-associatede transport system auxiliary component